LQIVHKSKEKIDGKVTLRTRIAVQCQRKVSAIRYCFVHLFISDTRLSYLI